MALLTAGGTQAGREIERGSLTKNIEKRREKVVGVMVGSKLLGGGVVESKK
nr:hypothetical protein [uncultured Desulfobulbus sp.]